MDKDRTDQQALTQGKALSGYWRRNTSTLESVELANLLKALRKVAGHLGPNAGTVEYAGMSSSGGSSILVDPGSVMGAYPIPPEKVDVLVGEVVHEALLGIEWSDRVWSLLEPEFTAMGPTDLVRFQKVVKTGEDIYLDSVLKDSVLGMYLAAARRPVMGETARGRSPFKAGPSLEALMRLWWTVSLDEQVVPIPDVRYQEPLHLLMMLTSRLFSIARDHTGVSARCEMRARMYRQGWEQLLCLLSGLPLLDKRLYRVPSHLRQTIPGETECLQETRKMPSLPECLIREIETHLAASSSDITPLIYSVVGYDNKEVVPTSRWDYHIPAHPVVDRSLVARLRTIFTSYSEQEKAVSRGLLSGRIDSRRLYRAPITGRCFKFPDSRPSMDWCVTLLMDASGSMRGPKWRMVENTVTTIHEALNGYRSSLAAYAYFEIDGICMVSSLIRGGRVFSVPPCGRTASGQAIIAAAMFMPKNRKRKLLIHVTDGESNLGCSVENGIQFCRRNNIHLVTLGCSCRDRKAMAEQYGNTIEFIGGFRQLPEAIEHLLGRTFLYGSVVKPLSDSRGCGAPDEGAVENSAVTALEDDGKESVE